MSNLALSQTPEEPNLVFAGDDGRIMTDSRVIAECFEKQHKDVLKALDNLECSSDFRERNFALSTYSVEGQKRSYNMYQMTRDGLSFLVMGFTGKKAAEWKEKFIAAFNKMESALLKKSEAPDLNNPNHLRLLLLDYSEKVIELESKIETDKPRLEVLERIEEADGSLCITDAAKVLQMRPKDLFSFLSQNGWTYKRAGGSSWLGYQSKTTSGLLEHKVNTVLRADGSEKVTEQVRITPKGLTRLAQLIKPAAKET